MPEIQAAFSPGSMRKEKRAGAGSSVLAAFAITALKIVVGFTTGSLGILSEAAHSGLDLIAALVTFFSVRVSDKPRRRSPVRPRQSREFLRLHRDRVVAADLRLDHLGGGEAALLSQRRNRTERRGLCRDASFHPGGCVAIPRAGPHCREV